MKQVPHCVRDDKQRVNGDGGPPCVTANYCRPEPQVRDLLCDMPPDWMGLKQVPHCVRDDIGGAFWTTRDGDGDGDGDGDSDSDSDSDSDREGEGEGEGVGVGVDVGAGQGAGR